MKVELTSRLSNTVLICTTRDGIVLVRANTLRFSYERKLHNVYKRTGFFVYMKSKILLTGLIVLVAIGIASFIFITSTNSYYSQSDDDNPLLVVQNNTGSSNGSTGGNNSSSSNSGNDVSGKVTLDQLVQHGTPQDCWVVYKGKVYDLTSWLPVHPGGSSTIAPSCGNTGFESAFERRHGTSQVARFMRVATYEGDLA